jgi:hypothetical protein
VAIIAVANTTAAASATRAAMSIAQPTVGLTVQMFAGPGFEGQQVGLFGNLRTLNDIGFNDRAGSLIIREGSWEMCEHADFGGQCVVYGPGRYPFLGGMNNRISSMRRVR